MSERGKLKKNVYIIALGQIIRIILSFLLVPVAARLLGHDGFGKYSLAMAIMYIVFMLHDAGVNTYLTREVARKHERADFYFVNALYFKLISFGIIIIPLFLFAYFSKYSDDTKVMILILGLYGVFNSLTQLCQSIFRAFEKMQYETIIVIGEKLLITIGGVSILVAGYGLLYFGSVFTFAGLISFVFAVIFLRLKFIPIKSKFDSKFVKKLFKDSLPFGISMFLVTIYDKIDIVMLSVMTDMSTVGWYSTAYRLLAITSVIPVILVTSIFPRMSRKALENRDEVSEIFTRSFKYLFFLAIPFVSLGMLLGDEIILLVFGSQYQNSVAAFKVLVWAAAILFLNILIGALFRASDNQKKLLAIQLGGVFVNFTLNLILIPTHSYIGAAIATVITEGLIFGVCFIFILRRVCKLDNLYFIFQGIIAVAIMTVVIGYMQNINLFINMVIAGFVYFGILYALKAFTLQEILLMRQKRA